MSKAEKVPGAYYAYYKNKEPWKKVCLFIVGLIVLSFTYFFKNFLCIPIGLILMLTAFFTKEYLVYEKGVEIRYYIKITDYFDLWPWSEITSVHRENNSGAYVRLHFGRGPVTRTYMYTRSESEEIMAYARRMAPSAVVKDLPKNAPAQKRTRIVRQQKKK